MADTTNILIVGVGGQGTLLASKIIGNAAMVSGLDVKQSEVHGMAQRGGSVVTHVRFGEQVFSPLVEPGRADIVLAFEKLEALRWLDYLKPGAVLVVNDQEIPPMPVITGMAKYPDDIMDRLLEAGVEVHSIPALAVAKQLEEIRAVNVVLLGAAARTIGFERAIWEQALAAAVPTKALKVNLEAFSRGWDL